MTWRWALKGTCWLILLLNLSAPNPSCFLPVVEEGTIGVPQAPAGADLAHAKALLQRLEVWSLRGARAAGGPAAK